MTNSVHPPLVSVLVNNYNYGAFLGSAIDSLLAQTYAPIEIIVVDDGSTDSSSQIIEQYVDQYGERIRPILKENGGQDSCFNAGFAASRGEIICFIDADDCFVKDKVAKIVARFEQSPDIGWCFNALSLIDVHTQESLGVTRAFPKQSHDTSQPCDFRRAMRQGRLPFYPMSTSGLCFRRRLLEQILPMPETFIKTSADRYLRCAAMGLDKGYFIAEPLTIQGIHGNNVATLRKDRMFLRERQIVTAVLLKQQFPRLTLYADRLFIRGLHSYHTMLASEKDAKYEPFIHRYWQQSKMLNRFLMSLFRFYHSRPWKKRYSFRPSSKQRQQIGKASS